MTEFLLWVVFGLAVAFVAFIVVWSHVRISMDEARFAEFLLATRPEITPYIEEEW